MDYGLRARDPLFIGAVYASCPEGWALIITGYWDPHPENHGASCWIFQVEGGLQTPKKSSLERGPGPCRVKAALGYFGALRMACAVVNDHPVTGLHGYGCDLEVREGTHIIRPRDGLRARVHDAAFSCSFARSECRGARMRFRRTGLHAVTCRSGWTARPTWLCLWPVVPPYASTWPSAAGADRSHA